MLYFKDATGYFKIIILEAPESKTTMSQTFQGCRAWGQQATPGDQESSNANSRHHRQKDLHQVK
jgi:hypothetical protein